MAEESDVYKYVVVDFENEDFTQHYTKEEAFNQANNIFSNDNVSEENILIIEGKLLNIEIAFREKTQ